MDERRFLVLDVAAAHKQEHSYFAKLIEQQESGGRAAMLYELLRHDCTGINLRQAPETDALREQKVLSFSPHEKWLLDRLDAGIIDKNALANGATISRDSVHKDYVGYVRESGERGPIKDRGGLGKFLNKVFGGHLKSNRSSATSKVKRARCWIFPPLSKCRNLFDQYSGSKHPWESQVLR